MIRSLAIAAALLLAACQPAVDAPATAPAEVAPTAVSVGDAWCRPSPNGARTGACYVTLRAVSEDRLTAGSTPAAASLQMHSMSMQNGMMTMGEIEGGLTLPAGQPITLAPGGSHLMLIGLAAPLAEGATVPLTFDFANGPNVTVQAAIRQPVAGAH